MALNYPFVYRIFSWCAKEIAILCFLMFFHAADLFWLKRLYTAKQRIICKTVEHGVASPMWNSEPPPTRCIISATGILTINAPQMPCIITKVVRCMPL